MNKKETREIEKIPMHSLSNSEMVNTKNDISDGCDISLNLDVVDEVNRKEAIEDWQQGNPNLEKASQNRGHNKEFDNKENIQPKTNNVEEEPSTNLEIRSNFSKDKLNVLEERTVS